MNQRRQTRGHGFGACLAGGLLFVQSGPTGAETLFGQDTLNLKLGTFLSEFDTQAGMRGPSGGAEIDLEEVLGLDSEQSSFRGELMWRVAPRHRVIIGYYSFDRASSGAAGTAFEFDHPDQGLIEVTAGVTVDSKFDWQLIPVSYAYSFAKSDNLEIAGTLGIHWADIELGLNGTFTVNGNTGQFIGASEAGSGPLPVIGVRADYAITPKWLVGGHAQYFGLDFDDFSGELLDLRLHTEYWFTNHIGAGIGYTWYDVNVSVDQGRGFELSTDYRYNGFEAYAAFRF